jgi:hypothetical protein
MLRSNCGGSIFKTTFYKSLNYSVSDREQARNPAQTKLNSFTQYEMNYSGGNFGRHYGSIYDTKNCGKNWIGDESIIEVPSFHDNSFPSRVRNWDIL